MRSGPSPARSVSLRPGAQWASSWRSSGSAGSQGRHKQSMEPAVAFRLRDHERPTLEVRVNFGVFAARNATPAEIDDLARELRGELASFTIVAEERHEFGNDVA